MFHKTGCPALQGKEPHPDCPDVMAGTMESWCRPVLGPGCCSGCYSQVEDALALVDSMCGSSTIPSCLSRVCVSGEAHLYAQA